MAIVSITSAHLNRTVGVLDLATRILTPISESGAWEGASWQPVTASASETTTPTPTVPPLGSDLARALGLDLQHDQPSGCEFYVEVNDPAGYCLDGIGSSKLDRWVVAQELQGRLPSDADRACFSAADRVGNMSNDSPDYQAAQRAFINACQSARSQVSSTEPSSPSR
jgi:hypothetical protein